MGKVDRSRGRSLSWRIIKDEWRSLRGHDRVAPPLKVPAREVDAETVAVVRAPNSNGTQRFVITVDAVVTTSGRTVIHDLTGHQISVHPDSTVRVGSPEQYQRWGRASTQAAKLLARYAEPYGCSLQTVVWGIEAGGADAWSRDLATVARLVAVSAGPLGEPPYVSLRREWATLAEVSMHRPEHSSVMPGPARIGDMAALMEVGSVLRRKLSARLGDPVI